MLLKDFVDVQDVVITPKFIDNMLRRVALTVCQSYGEVQKIISLDDH
jgi:hypothetical protein